LTYFPKFYNDDDVVIAAIRSRKSGGILAIIDDDDVAKSCQKTYGKDAKMIKLIVNKSLSWCKDDIKKWTTLENANIIEFIENDKNYAN
jgi:hypothetical protein